LLLACCCAVILGGCATPQVDSVLRDRPSGLPASQSIQVPFFAETDHLCGPSALAMVLDASGDAVTPQDLVGSVFIPARKGSLAAEMLAAARRHGRLAMALPGRLDAVLAEVAAGRPVIVFQNLSLPIFPLWHYSVVVGYDLDRGFIVLQSGGQRATPMWLSTFEHTWARSRYWAMVALPADQLPVSAQPMQIFAAAAALERVDRGAARRAYRTMTRQMPDLSEGWIGLGNTAFVEGDLPESAAAFARATELNPAGADAWNNLATALSALGQNCEAARAARRAMQIGGPHMSEYEQTAAGIDAAACLGDGLR
jgi:tetratricopeptide (TPR) repeat protein